jgi:hypothetical protein
MLDHLVGLLLRALIAQVTGAKPLQVHPGAVRPVLDRHLDQSVSGVMKRDGIN